MSRGLLLLERLALGALIDAIDLRVDEPMARHTTLRLGGPADLWARPRDVASLAALLERCAETSTPVHFVGGGTNLLVRDGGLRGVVINLGRINRVSRPDPDHAPTVVEVEAGASTGRLLTHAIGWELGGVEFLAGVPGSVGGGLIMNAGTYLGEFTSVVEQVRSLDLHGRERTRIHAECGFRYRASDLPREEIVVGARLTLRPRPRAEIDAEVAALRQRRHEREPKRVANNGSTFKNPPGEFAGRLIEAAGLKGAAIGGAVVSPKHANWLVVDPSARRGTVEAGSGAGVTACTAADMLALIEHVRAEVERVHAVRLETEVRIIGEDP